MRESSSKSRRALSHSASFFSEGCASLTAWQVICAAFKRPLGRRRARALTQRPPICTAVWSTWVASSKKYSGRSVGRNVMDLCMSGIACQRVGKIYRQRSIMKRPGPVNELSMFVAYASLFTSSHLFSHLISRPFWSLEVRHFYEVTGFTAGFPIRFFGPELHISKCHMVASLSTL